MNKTLLVALLASTLALGASVSQADNSSGQRDGYSKQEGGKHHKKGGKQRGGNMKRIAEKLELTDAQQAELKTLRTQQKASASVLREQMKTVRTDMKALDTTSADYDSQVAVIADKKANLDRQIFIQRSQARQQFAAVLTTEQLAKFEAMKSKRGGKKGHGKHNKNKG